MTERKKASRSFYEDEFVYPGGDFKKVDPKLVVVAQWLRDAFDAPVTINNYATGGQYKESGLRDINTTTGAKKSAHKEGKAIDIKVKGFRSDYVYDFCLNHQMELYAMGIREIEDKAHTPTWTHLSTRGNWLSIKIIKP